MGDPNGGMCGVLFKFMCVSNIVEHIETGFHACEDVALSLITYSN